MTNKKPHFELNYTQIDKRLFTHATPQVFPSARLLVFNHELARELGLMQGDFDEAFYENVFSGKALIGSIKPIAQAYAGHQYGHFTMLGDGRAHLLTEIEIENHRLDLQLKGSGETPYSRRGDGKAAIGPMLREYLISEAMHALNIPTTRSLAVLSTGETIVREKLQQGAVLARIASSHIRIGTFEFVKAQNDLSLLKKFVEYTIDRHYPHLKDHQANPYLAFLEAVIERQAQLIAQWQSVGFVHGVMNTDNMSVSGETIDYGPCAFMNTYSPETVFSSIDKRGRYAYGNQPHMSAWNLARLAETLLPLIDEDPALALERANAALGQFSGHYTEAYLNLMTKKLGILTPQASDAELIAEFLNMLFETQADYTQAFIDLTHEKYDQMACKAHPGFEKWVMQLKQRRLGSHAHEEAVKQVMRKSNPSMIPRNHLVEEALAAAEKGDLQPFKRLLGYLQDPFSHSEEAILFGQAPVKNDGNYKTFCGT